MTVVVKILCVLGICMCVLFLKWAFCGGKIPRAGESSIGMNLYNLFIGIPFTVYLYWLFVSQFVK